MSTQLRSGEATLTREIPNGNGIGMLPLWQSAAVQEATVNRLPVPIYIERQVCAR
jgi:hypothetical protein